MSPETANRQPAPAALDQARQAQSAKAWDQAAAHARRALALAPGSRPAAELVLEVHLRLDDDPGFLDAYRRWRGCLGLDQGREFDQALERLAGQDASSLGFAARRDLALIQFRQGKAAPGRLAALWRERPQDPDLVLALALLNLYDGGFDIDLDLFRQVLAPRDWRELKACQDRQASPALADHPELLRCVVCGASPLAWAAVDRLTCPDCGRDYPLRDGVPLLLRGDYREYLDIEPEYQASYGQRDAIRTLPDLRHSPVYQHQLWEQPRPLTNVEYLSWKYHHLPLWDQLLDFCVENLPSPGGARVLDVGAASGRDAFALARLFPDHDFFGVEIVLDGCLLAQRFRGQQRNQFICADASQALPFVDASFDLVYSMMAIEHCRQNMMDEVLRVLKPGGRALIAGPSEKSYILFSQEAAAVYLASLDARGKFDTHGLSGPEYLEMFRDFHVVSHSSDAYFMRMLLESQAVNQMRREAAEELYREFCGVLGQALNRDDQTRWHNYIQVFVLEKPDRREDPAAGRGSV